MKANLKIGICVFDIYSLLVMHYKIPNFQLLRSIDFGIQLPRKFYQKFSFFVINSSFNDEANFAIISLIKTSIAHFY